jgi:hypothetical protein
LHYNLGHLISVQRLLIRTSPDILASAIVLGTLQDHKSLLGNSRQKLFTDGPHDRSFGVVIVWRGYRMTALERSFGVVVA